MSRERAEQVKMRSKMGTAKNVSKKTGKAKVEAAKPEGRKKSLFAEVGEQARREAQRKLLLKTWKEQGLNMLATAEVLGMAGSPAVIRALLDLAPEEYEAAKARGDITSANRRS